MDSFSAHGDQKEMSHFLSNQQNTVSKVFLVHGEEQTQIAYKGHLNKIGFDHVDIPDLGQEVII